MLTKLIKNLEETRRTIVFTEGTDPRILTAADRLIKNNLLDIILIGNPLEVSKAASICSADISGARIIDPSDY